MNIDPVALELLETDPWAQEIVPRVYQAVRLWRAECALSGPFPPLPDSLIILRDWLHDRGHELTIFDVGDLVEEICAVPLVATSTAGPEINIRADVSGLVRGMWRANEALQGLGAAMGRAASRIPEEFLRDLLPDPRRFVGVDHGNDHPTQIRVTWYDEPPEERWRLGASNDNTITHPPPVSHDHRGIPLPMCVHEGRTYVSADLGIRFTVFRAEGCREVFARVDWSAGVEVGLGMLQTLEREALEGR